ncbi:hypothetical protein [Caenispirillum bisanense]|uniref:Uncharacterized protein n=1 Tax=Caenispirillum bisanense TaxID=414052 RepID=A0A286GMA8_9PROT|nr:hypothetical protein [Caenispirillum bisanense]SOD96640.1 hypothetical protein SAMN05421508_10618 [Caenispirillum bisanense]
MWIYFDLSSDTEEFSIGFDIRPSRSIDLDRLFPTGASPQRVRSGVERLVKRCIKAWDVSDPFSPGAVAAFVCQYPGMVEALKRACTAYDEIFIAAVSGTDKSLGVFHGD